MTAAQYAEALKRWEKADADLQRAQAEVVAARFMDDRANVKCATLRKRADKLWEECLRIAKNP